ncbi:MAG TPA: GreA/GreB family elongation factor [Phycisphaerae bacterium]|nr:GreA/GreB family elongation factor [Phycisphaerae bacterium]HOJ72356.1 GreA/GreB family elongation factor [Phycisphaerae bacterium]HOM49982.1 GreA/GreB family elongation factor [Phycisphaerae bacterium]HON66227.1 GreA/GreB family elongation factor [Phycisphaerae bacterium]HOQ87430.1 GreA/GreB family elongation factor [Phycisphaerae bacterium]
MSICSAHPPLRLLQPYAIEPALNDFSENVPIVTEADYRRLRQLIRRMRYTLRHGCYVHELERKLRRARVVPPQEVPPDVVTMNSRVKMESLAEGETRSVLLVYPHLGMNREDYECVLGRLGTALLGRRTGDRIKDACSQPMRIGPVLYQPEAAGDFYL